MNGGSLLRPSMRTRSGGAALRLRLGPLIEALGLNVRARDLKFFNYEFGDNADNANARGARKNDLAPKVAKILVRVVVSKSSARCAR